MNNIENIQEYIPTVYVNDSEPDLDETNLNKTEQAIKRVTDAANKAIDALKQLDREKLALSAISNVLSDATDKVPSLALANTMQLAINDLNSNLEGYYKLSGGTAIPNGANLTGYKTPGNYYCPNNTVAASLTGSPTQKAFTLKIELSTGNSYPCQTIRDFTTGKIYFRTFNIDTNTWSEWGNSIQNSDLKVTLKNGARLEMYSDVDTSYIDSFSGGTRRHRLVWSDGGLTLYKYSGSTNIKIWSSY